MRRIVSGSSRFSRQPMAHHFALRPPVLRCATIAEFQRPWSGPRKHDQFVYFGLHKHNTWSPTGRSLPPPCSLQSNVSCAELDLSKSRLPLLAMILRHGRDPAVNERHIGTTGGRETCLCRRLVNSYALSRPDAQAIATHRYTQNWGYLRIIRLSAPPTIRSSHLLQLDRQPTKKRLHGRRILKLPQGPVA